MAKEDIFLKINLKDYNNILENILEQKNFAEDVKNLLLSMLYKIESGYEDYEKIKVNVSSKKCYLKKIVQIINEKCKEIKLIKPLSEESKILEEKNVNYIVNKEEGKIISYPNERILLEALITLNQKDIILEEKYELFNIAIEKILQKGNRMSITEAIRDFNGWSWDITTSQMESKNINIIYQNLLILLGNAFLQTIVTGKEEQIEEIDLPNNEILRSKYNNSFGMTKEEMQEEKIDYLQKMKEILNERYGKERANSFYMQFIKTSLAVGSNESKEQKEIILKKQEQVKKALGEMKNNKQYLEILSEKKKEITKKIRQIDTYLSESKLLREEYERRNSKLPNKEKIFSISHLKIMLEKERERNLNEIKKCNKQMEPKEFVKRKKELEELEAFFNEIGVEKEIKTKEEEQINKLQLHFLECFIEKIKNTETKKEIRKFAM